MVTLSPSLRVRVMVKMNPGLANLSATSDSVEKRKVRGTYITAYSGQARRT